MQPQQKILAFLSLGILSLLLIIGWKLPDRLISDNRNISSTQIVVSAAASLKEVMTEIKTIYQQEYPKTKIVLNFASSGSLQRQIEQGAPVDVFISAAVDKMVRLDKQDLLLTDTRQDLLKNKIVLIAPVTKNRDKFKLDKFEDLTNERIKTIALGEPQSVPAGNYAKEVLDRFEITDRVDRKTVYGKDVRQILNYVATGNADAGIVYYTDALSTNNVRIVAIAPENSHSPVVYPVAVIKGSKNIQAAKTLVEFLTTSEARSIYDEYGFYFIKNSANRSF